MSGALKYGPRRRNYLLYRGRNKLRGVKQISPDHHNNITFLFTCFCLFADSQMHVSWQFLSCVKTHLGHIVPSYGKMTVECSVSVD